MNLNKKGFSLIELLAVIVVLAIIMAVATTQVVPYLSGARKDGLASTANAVVQAAESKYLVDKMTSTSSVNTKCYTVAELIDEKLVSRISKDKIKGKIEVVEDDTDPDNMVFKITIYDIANGYMISGYDYTTKGAMDRSDVVKGTSEEEFTTCTVAP